MFGLENADRAHILNRCETMRGGMRNIPGEARTAFGIIGGLMAFSGAGWNLQLRLAGECN